MHKNALNKLYDDRGQKKNSFKVDVFQKWLIYPNFYMRNKKKSKKNKNRKSIFITA